MPCDGSLLKDVLQRGFLGECASKDFLQRTFGRAIRCRISFNAILSHSPVAGNPSTCCPLRCPLQEILQRLALWDVR
eukprot:9205675-Pyramimonas_sp.AAC.1